PNTTIALSAMRFRHSVHRKIRRGKTQKIQRYNGFTLSQQAMPRISPAPNAHHMLTRFIAINSSQSPDITNQVVGASAAGDTPTIARSGESGAGTLAAMAVCQP